MLFPPFRVHPRSGHERKVGAFAPIAIAGAAVLVALALLPSCGYKLAGKNRYLPESLRRIAIPVFVNETRRTEIEQRITESLLEEFARRGRYEAQPQREGADAVLEGTITSYSSTPVTLSSAGRAERIEVVVQARVRLTDLRDGKILWSQEHFIFRGQYQVDTKAGTYFDREIEAINRISQDFAQTVVTSLLEGF